MANRIDLSNILINFLKKARYERHIEEETLEEDQFYAVTDGSEKTEYGDLFGNIEDQADLFNALYASRLLKMEMCNDPRVYALLLAMKNNAEEGTDEYVEYDLVIPYYQTKDGVKIVDAQYKWLVDDLYELSGEGNYIIIDEVNQKFRLPLPDIYSQIEKKTSFTLRKWED